MATRTLSPITYEARTSYRNSVALAATDVTEPFFLPRGGALLTVTVSGTFGGTVSLKGTLDGSTWFDLLSHPGGSAVSFTAAGAAEISTGFAAVRAEAGSGVSAVTVTFSNTI